MVLISGMGTGSPSWWQSAPMTHCQASEEQGHCHTNRCASTSGCLRTPATMASWRQDGGEPKHLKSSSRYVECPATGGLDRRTTARCHPGQAEVAGVGEKKGLRNALPSSG